MIWWRKVLFAALTLVLLLGAVEGAARLVWDHLEHEAMQDVAKAGHVAIKKIHVPKSLLEFMKQPDGLYGFKLRPGFHEGDQYVNKQGFAQHDEIPVEKTPDVLRIVALGESTTQGTEKFNYPLYLKKAIEKNAVDLIGEEIMNAGVEAWVSDQVALRVEHEISKYKPDVAIIYCGWNDFYLYDPFLGTPTTSAFVANYNAQQLLAMKVAGSCKSVALASIMVQRLNAQLAAKTPAKAHSQNRQGIEDQDVYKYYLINLDRIVTGLKKCNPNIKIFICTLVGRHPCETDEEFRKGDHGRAFWMNNHQVTRHQAAHYVNGFNNVIRDFARAHREVHLIDCAKYFEPLDRRALQVDFCHMWPSGYELLAEVMYAELIKTGTIQGRVSPRLAQLTKQFRH
ncbi:MAG: SGNH/GDSL hydrolase family protein [Candidatus Obscuribacterales bacterium]|nr:SGNH/GDSL hydrolase family protein [Candidatus Obscuribacterales bacterium]